MAAIFIVLYILNFLDGVVGGCERIACSVPMVGAWVWEAVPPKVRNWLSCRALNALSQFDPVQSPRWSALWSSRVLTQMALAGTVLTLGVRVQFVVPLPTRDYARLEQDFWTGERVPDAPAQALMFGRDAIEWHVDHARSAGIDGFVLDWWGPDNPTDSNLQTLLDVAAAHNVKVTVDVDLSSPFWSNEGDVANALVYLRRYYASPAWYRRNGRPVLLVSPGRPIAPSTFDAATSERDQPPEVVWRDNVSPLGFYITPWWIAPAPVAGAVPADSA